MSDRYHTSTLRVPRDWLLASCAALTLVFSWYFTAALDSYAAASHAIQQDHHLSAFEAAFIAANREPAFDRGCEGDACLTHLAASESLRAQL